MNVRHISGGYNTWASTEFSGVIFRLIGNGSQTVISYRLIWAVLLMSCLHRCDQCGQSPRSPETRTGDRSGRAAKFQLFSAFQLFLVSHCPKIFLRRCLCSLKAWAK